MAFCAIAIATLLLAAGCKAESNTQSQAPEAEAQPQPPFDIVSQRIQPSATGPGIDNERRRRNYHYVTLPEQAAGRKNVLLVFLGGSLSSPAQYIDISRFAAQLGYAVINLRYVNNRVVGTTCLGDDACFTRFHGETLFGQGQAYAPGAPAYDASAIDTDKTNSIVNRLVGVLDFLASQSQSARHPAPDGYWEQFLIADDQSPYVGMATGNAYPNWQKIIIAGHSQGAGHAAFLPLHLPAGVAMHRVVMFSGPNDHVDENSATWVNSTSATPPDRFWGLRNAHEGIFGEFTDMNWAHLGAAGSGGVGGTGSDSGTRIGAGGGDPSGAHRLVITVPHDAQALTNHNSTALDSAHTDAVKSAWRYLFTGGGADG